MIFMNFVSVITAFGRNLTHEKESQLSVYKMKIVTSHCDLKFSFPANGYTYTRFSMKNV